VESALNSPNIIFSITIDQKDLYPDILLKDGALYNYSEKTSFLKKFFCLFTGAAAPFGWGPLAALCFSL